MSGPLLLRGVEIFHRNCFLNMARPLPDYFTFHYPLNIVTVSSGSLFWPKESSKFPQLIRTSKYLDCNSIQIDHQPEETIFQFIILTFIYSSTCFGRFPAHHQELNDCSDSLRFYLRIVMTVVLCSWSGRTALLPSAINHKGKFELKVKLRYQKVKHWLNGGRMLV